MSKKRLKAVLESRSMCELRAYGAERVKPHPAYG